MRLIGLLVITGLLFAALERQGGDRWKSLRDGAIAAFSQKAPEKAKAPVKKISKRRRRPPRETQPPAVRGDDWQIEGEVYDLLTLAAIANATLTFREDPTKPAIIAKTDALGHFSATLPPRPARGYTAAFSHPDYDEVFLEESRAPYKRWSLERRQDAFAEALTAEVLHVPIFGDVAGITYNVAAIPKSGKL